MLNDITDADDADHFSGFNHEQMSHTCSLRHQTHGAFQRIVRRNGNYGMGYDVQNRHGKRSLPMLRNGMYDVAL